MDAKLFCRAKIDVLKRIRGTNQKEPWPLHRKTTSLSVAITQINCAPRVLGFLKIKELKIV